MSEEAAKYFKFDTKGQSPRRIVQGIGEVDFNNLSLQQAEKLWMKNHPFFVELTEEGIQKYLNSDTVVRKKSRYTVNDLIKMVNLSDCQDDCTDFQKYYPESKELTKAINARLKFLKRR